MTTPESRPVFGVLSWGAPGAAGVIGGLYVVLRGAVGTGIFMILVGGSMVWYARRLRRRGVRW